MTDIVERLRIHAKYDPDQAEAADVIEQLREDKRKAAMDYLALDAQLEMHLTEIERLKKKCDKQAMILRSLFPDKFPDSYFICGEAGEKDQNGLPAKIMVVPAYGVDWSMIYERTDKATGPEW